MDAAVTAGLELRGLRTVRGPNLADVFAVKDPATLAEHIQRLSECKGLHVLGSTRLVAGDRALLGHGARVAFAPDSVGGGAQALDWSYNLVPESYLTTKFVAGWAPGASDVPPSVNGSPIWVTALADTTLQIDFEGDGTVDSTYAIKAPES